MKLNNTNHFLGEGSESRREKLVKMKEEVSNTLSFSSFMEEKDNTVEGSAESWKWYRVYGK